MAKDPAFLFYPNDWIGGTMGMTFEEKGAYVELLMLQFNRGHMTEHMIAQTVGQIWVKIQVKFRMDSQGLWYNPRLDEEKEKRQEFTKSRRNNVLGTNQYTKKNGHIKGHMTSHMEDVNVDVNKTNSLENKEGVGGKKNSKGWCQKPGENEHSLDLPEIKLNSVIELIRIASGKSPTKEEVLGLWMVFKIQNFTGENFYQSPEKTFSHFVNWSKQQKINGTHQQQSGKSNPRTAGVNKLLSQVKDDIRARGNADNGG